MEVSICEREGGKKQGNIEWKGWQADSSLNVVNAFSRTHNQEYLHHHFSYITGILPFHMKLLQGTKACCELT